MKQIASDLAVGISGLTDVMEYFSASGNVEHLPLSVLVCKAGQSIKEQCEVTVRIAWLFTQLTYLYFSRLAYAAMPLVLAAIDLKLSPSYRETQKRQKRLDSISRIIRHSESLYDVTDFVALGANQILQLAYSVTRNIFQVLSCDSKLRIRPESDHQDLNLRVQKHRSGLRPRARAKSWSDAFLSCPRAYLLISTSVDYSLAVGRLPCHDSLPLSVRQLPSSSGIAWLPWSAGLTTENKKLHEMGGGEEINTEAHWASARYTSTVAVTSCALNEHDHLHQNGAIHSEHRQGFQNQGFCDGNEWLTNPKSERQDERSDHKHPVTVNLDYLEFDARVRSPTPSSIWRLKVSDQQYPPLAFIAHEYTALRNVAFTYPEDPMTGLDVAQPFLPGLPQG